MASENICNFCSKEFSSKINLSRHQKTTKSCLKIQGKKEDESMVECENCNKKLAFQYYKQHKIKCDLSFEENIKLLNEIKELKSSINNIQLELKEEKEITNKLRMELVEYKTTVNILKEQNDKLSNKATTVNNNNNKTVVINLPLLTDEVLRECAANFNIDNAYNINGITRHLTSSLEDHVNCTDPSRNIFKYFNEKEEEITDPDLENLLPQYLNTIRDRNNFLYKEVFEYFRKNNVPLNKQTDYAVFYQALNNIIEKNGEQNKYTEKYKQHMVRECKRQFLEKNKKKEKTLTKKLTDEEIMMNVIETGGSVSDYVNRVFPYIEDETDEQFIHRRSLEDLFRKKKKQWKESK